MSIYRRVLAYYRPFSVQTAIGLILSLPAIGLSLLKPSPVKIIVDDVLQPNPQAGGADAANGFAGALAFAARAAPSVGRNLFVRAAGPHEIDIDAGAGERPSRPGGRRVARDSDGTRVRACGSRGIALSPASAGKQ